MRPERQTLHNKLYEILLIVSFIPIIIKSIEYLLAGIFYPFLIMIILTSPFLYLFKKKKNTPKLIKYWSILLIGYGLLRIVLHTLIITKPSGVPSGAFYQFTFWYTFKSVFYILFGISLFIKRKLIVRSIFFK